MGWRPIPWPGRPAEPTRRSSRRYGCSTVTTPQAARSAWQSKSSCSPASKALPRPRSRRSPSGSWPRRRSWERRSEVEGVDFGVNARLNVVALESGRDDVADADVDHAGALGEALAPQAAAVVRDRHHWQAERPIKAGKAGPQSRALPVRHPGAFGKDRHRPALFDCLFSFGEHVAQGAGAGFAVEGGA